MYRYDPRQRLQNVSDVCLLWKIKSFCFELHCIFETAAGPGFLKTKVCFIDLL